MLSVEFHWSNSCQKTPSGLWLKVFSISTSHSEGYSLLHRTKIGSNHNWKNFESLNLDLNSIPTVHFMSKNAFRMVIEGILKICSIFWMLAYSDKPKLVWIKISFNLDNLKMLLILIKRSTSCLKPTSI